MLRRSVRDSKLKHRSRSTHIAGRSSKNMRRNGGRMRGNLATFERSQGRRLAKLTSFLADSLVRTFPLLERVPGYATEREAAYSLSCCGLLGNYDRERSSWRTSQLSLLTDWTSYLERLPRSGMTVSGKLYALPMLAHRISANAGSVSLFPTVTTQDGENNAGASQWARNSPPLNVMAWATPTASDATTGAIIGTEDQYFMTSTGMPRKINKNGKDGSVGLARLLKIGWATPTTDDANNVSRKSGTFDSLARDTFDPDQKEKSLNPDWVELLMGYPVGWTSPDSQPDRMKRSTATSRRELARQKRKSSARIGLRHSEMQLCRSKRSRFFKRFTNF